MDGRIAESGAQISISPLPVVRGEVQQFAHVFQNLLSNTIKYRKQNQPPRVAISAEIREGMCVIAVRDNGIGFDQRYAAAFLDSSNA